METNDEIWKYVPGTDNMYQISNKSRARSLFYGKVRILKKCNNGMGYPYWGFCRFSIKTKYLTHLWIAKLFIPNPDNLPIVEHKNNIKHDDRIDNLIWSTQSKNTKNAFNDGLIPKLKGEKNSQAKLTDAQAIDIINSKLFGTELGKIYGVTKTTINNIKSGRTFKHLKQL